MEATEGAGSRLAGGAAECWPLLLLHTSVLAAVLAARDPTPRGLPGASSGLQQLSCSWSLRWLWEDAPRLSAAVTGAGKQVEGGAQLCKGKVAM